jgi:hypothetical protein
MKKTGSLYLLFILMLFGCATWVAVGGPYKMDSQNFSVELPAGWRKFNLAGNQLLITKDGFSLQKINILRLEVAKDLPHTKRKLAKGMLPQEAAEVVIDNFRSNTGIMNQEILENSPAQLAGQPGFKIVYKYQTNDKLNVKGVIYGFVSGNWFYEILYEAAERHYFARDLPAFEKIKETFSLIKPAAT